MFIKKNICYIAFTINHLVNNISENGDNKSIACFVHGLSMFNQFKTFFAE